MCFLFFSSFFRPFHWPSGLALSYRTAQAVRLTHIEGARGHQPKLVVILQNKVKKKRNLKRDSL